MAFKYSLVYTESGLATEVTAKLFRAGSQVGSEITLSDSANSFIYVGTPDSAAVAGDLAVYYRDAIPVNAEDVYGSVTCVGAGTIQLFSAGFVGDYKQIDVLNFAFHTNKPITNPGSGLLIYKNNDLGGPILGTGITLSIDFDGETNVHQVTLSIISAFFDVDSDYFIILSGATIGGETITAVVGLFSVENRFYQDFRRHVAR